MYVASFLPICVRGGLFDGYFSSMSAFSSPPAPPKGPHPFTYMGTDTLQWVPQALLLGKPLGSPLFSVEKLAKHAAELTPRGEELVNDSLRALLSPPHTELQKRRRGVTKLDPRGARTLQKRLVGLATTVFATATDDASLWRHF